MNGQPVALAVSVLVAGGAVVANAQAIYWTDTTDSAVQQSTIRRMATIGSPAETIVSGQGHVRGIAVDAQGGKVYWAGGFGGTLFVKRVNLDGTDAETLIAGATQNGAVDVALDTVNGKMYWTTETSIGRANLDGSSPEDIGPVDAVNPVAIAVDHSNGKIYWTDLAGAGIAKIVRADLDGSSPVTIVIGLDDPLGLAIDTVGEKLYWTELPNQRIQRASLDGSGIETLIVGLDGPTAIELDPFEGKMYWADAAAMNRIQRANLDGSKPEAVLASDGLPFGIALLPGKSIPTVSTWGAVGMSLLSLTTATLILGRKLLRAAR